ncbi:MAG: 3-hydroxybutyryl-CoA dehydratase [Candidatus Binatia bacterium]|nr:MAG: 3-hydroxybutyryl-CoA dehydratase [Candidatus Binatia bacterium]
MKRGGRGARSSGIAREDRGKAVWLRLPERLSEADAQRLSDEAEELRFRPELCVVVLMPSARDFCLGIEESERRFVDCVRAVASLPQPVLAVLRGRTAARGCELALACDLRVASADARFFFPGPGDAGGLGFGAIQRLVRLVGPSRALGMMLRERPVGAAEALRAGLVSRVCRASALRGEVRRLVSELSAKAPLALRLAKEAVYRGLELTLEQGLRLEDDLYVLLQTTRDRKEGIRSFMSGRRPRFVGA